MGVLGYLMQWRSHPLGVPMSGRSDEWKSRCNFPPSGGKVAHPAFNDEWAFRFNGRSHLMGVPKNRASMVERSVQFAALRQQIAPPAFYDEWAFPKIRASKLNETKRKSENKAPNKGHKRLPEHAI